MKNKLVFFEDCNSKQLETFDKDNTLILFPVGTTEEHGPHLPVSTDATIAKCLAREIALGLKEEGQPVLVLPTFWSGFSPKEMSRWPGTIRVRPRVVIDVIYDVCTSVIEMGFKKIVLLDCHGQHGGILNVVLREVIESHQTYMSVVKPLSFASSLYQKIRKSEIGGSCHAGELETALMLYFKQPVDKDAWTNKDIIRYHSEFFAGDLDKGNTKSGVFLSTFGVQKSKTGAYGDPTVASEETGEKIVKEIVNVFKRFAKEFMSLKRI